ncbi:MAG: Bax inhibitor-1/YccA family protein [Pseudomonadota bacterium]
MQNAKPVFGQRGVPVTNRRAANPYTGQAEPLGGKAAFDKLTGVDDNLRAFMLGVYNYMALGMVVTGMVALATYMMTVTTDPAQSFSDAEGLWPITETEYLTELGVLLWATPLSYVVCFGPLAILLFTGSMWRNMSSGGAFAVFMVVAALIGVSFSGLALTYTNSSIAQMFFVTATAFGSLSLYGYTTGRDLSGWGSFLWMGLIGLILALIVNIFLQSDMMEFVLSIVGVIVFAGFTAYDTQMIRDAYSDQMTKEEASKTAITGALHLYLDFINMFRFLLALFGQEE